MSLLDRLKRLLRLEVGPVFSTREEYMAWKAGRASPASPGDPSTERAQLPSREPVRATLERSEYTPDRSSVLLREATQRKKAGDFDGAVELLREAYREMEREGPQHGAEIYLRLPMMLHLAGRNDEAWAEYNRLLIHPPDPRLSKSGLQVWHSEVYDKMRLFRQREGKHLDAARFGILAFVCRAMAFHGDGDLEDLRLYRDPETIRGTLEPLLGRADRLDAIDPLVSITAEFLARVPKADLGRFVQQVGSALSSRREDA